MVGSSLSRNYLTELSFHQVESHTHSVLMLGTMRIINMCLNIQIMMREMGIIIMLKLDLSTAPYTSGTLNVHTTLHNFLENVALTVKENMLKETKEDLTRT